MRIGKHDAAVIIKEEGVGIVVPHDDPVPDHVLYATAIAVLLTEKDKEFIRLINKKIKKFTSMVNE